MEKWLITGANQLLTLQGAGRPKTGKEMNDLGIIEDGAVAVEKDTIIAVGTRKEVESEARKRWGSWEKVNHMDATGKVIMPGLIDPHTHLVYAGSREDELNMRLNGKTYLEILEAGGGILSTTQRTRAAGIDELVEQAKARLDRFLKNGVTTVEAKSGYGLSPEHELKQLRVTKRLNEEHPVEVVSTFMGAHAVPKQYQKQPDAYVRLITDEMIPRVVSERLAEFCDVFCERGVFSVEQSETILRAAKAAGLIPKIHADELEPTGGAELAARIGAISADHLLKASDEGIRALAKAKVVAVLLPGTAFFLMAPFADGRKMIDAGVPVALSTDCNPGSSPTESLLLMMNLACFHMKMTPAEVITAVTVNAAHAIGRADRIGSLEPGKQADLVVFDVPNYLHLTYHYGSNDVERVMKKGKWVV
ncbi:imidazolonepropionase [Thermoactinomyces sp. CICC 23799]|uniref:imidazolonepropionase n=1 Tax=Thermoactinomyces sp. CICC 23799 TaxID=2767429 RepID=UPI0018DC8800|nr:imidazolonepropionase [Thermoactinomyces sp. CICC 23799]MBH8601760.1 imidazolonepropionase [Thermoactinomyces sp. CICC 23799]